MYRLYYSPGAASLAPHLVLRMLGVAHELVLVDRSRDQQRSSAYLALNPKAVIPTLVADELILTESAAICMYLADRHPAGRLAPVQASPARARWREWMVYLTNTVQPESMLLHYPERYAADEPVQAQLVAAATERLEGHYRYVDSQLGDTPYLLGEHPGTCDLFLLMLARWARELHRPPRHLPRLGALLERLLTHTAVRACLDAEGISAPYV
ncbi:glutathione S-transferase family protein [Haliangium sp.]|uniref:glutathione S-transferase family protein n=1 Tax=Haliangium sp. TaxID=2663208 RepID=UPI003D14233D